MAISLNRRIGTLKGFWEKEKGKEGKGFLKTVLSIPWEVADSLSEDELRLVKIIFFLPLFLVTLFFHFIAPLINF